MISWSSCQTELPNNAAFCLSCGHPIETDAQLKAPGEIDRDWLIDVFASDGYKCTEDAKNPNEFLAEHDERMTLMVSLRPRVELIGFVSILGVKRARRDELRLRAALDEFNRKSLIWTAYMLGESTLASSTLFTLSARTSPRSIKAFVEASNDAFWAFVQRTGLARHLS